MIMWSRYLILKRVQLIGLKSPHWISGCFQMGFTGTGVTTVSQTNKYQPAKSTFSMEVKRQADGGRAKEKGKRRDLYTEDDETRGTTNQGNWVIKKKATVDGDSKQAQKSG